MMPFAHIAPHTDPNSRRLEDRLVQEWTHPKVGSAEPIIIEESDRQQTPENLDVIWGEWAEVSQCVQTKIILNAYKRVRGRNFALNVVDAMDFTVEEAKRASIEYAPLEPAA